MPNIDNFFEGLDRKVRTISNPDFQSTRITPSLFDIHSSHWILTVSVRKETVSIQDGVFFVDLAQVSGTSASAEKAYALSLLVCIEAVEEFNRASLLEAKA